MHDAPARHIAALKALGGLYALYGVTLISWVPRLPEVKSQLGLGISTFGFLLSLGTVGSLSGMLLMAHAINRRGTRPVLVFAFTLHLICLVVMTHLRSAVVFALLFMVFAASTATTSLALNSHGTHLNDLLKRSVLGRMHGLWSVGALTSGFLATLIADHLSLVWHVTIIAAFSAPTGWALTRRLLSPEEEWPLTERNRSPRVTDVLTPQTWAILLAMGLAGGSVIEYSSGDWAAIHARNLLDTSLGGAAFAYTCMMIGLTIGRFTNDQLCMRWGTTRVIRVSSLVIILGVLLLAPVSAAIETHSRIGALTVLYIGFAFAGLGTSGMVPMFMTAGAARSGAARSVILAQLAVMQSLIVWAHKAVISFLAGQFTVGVGLLWAGAMALVAYGLAGVTEKQRPRHSAVAQ